MLYNAKNNIIDIDDTTFLTVKSMLKYADIFEEEISGVPRNKQQSLLSCHGTSWLKL